MTGYWWLPFKFKSRLIKMMEEQIEEAEKGRPASIIMKMNSLTDREIIDMLSKASNAGVKIKLIIRGICCIIPGLPGKTEILKLPVSWAGSWSTTGYTVLEREMMLKFISQAGI